MQTAPRTCNGPPERVCPRSRPTRRSSARMEWGSRRQSVKAPVALNVNVLVPLLVTVKLNGGEGWPRGHVADFVARWRQPPKLPLPVTSQADDSRSCKTRSQGQSECRYKHWAAILRRHRSEPWPGTLPERDHDGLRVRKGSRTPSGGNGRPLSHTATPLGGRGCAGFEPGSSEFRLLRHLSGRGLA